MTDRLRCCVPFCRHTTSRVIYAEWICGDHWRMVTKVRRQVWGRMRKQLRRYGPERVHSARWFRIWDRLKREAIERAVGL